jgi:ABC-type nickel/cobalt efflux system permease component RcnA
MSKQDHAKHQHAVHTHEHATKPAGGGLHKDWRTWVVVGLMLVGMAVYILSMDEEIVPGEPLQPQMPAAAE